jgi:hypothetical protein
MEILRRRCTAIGKTNGERCGRAPIPGGTVCVVHGGSAPAVQLAAKTRLLAMVEPILGVFEDIVSTWNSVKCETCGRPTGDTFPVIQVGKLVLDRAGFGPRATMEVVNAPPDPYAEMNEDDLIAHFERVLDSLRRRRRLTAIDADVYTVPEDEDANRVNPLQGEPRVDEQRANSDIERLQRELEEAQAEYAAAIQEEAK